MAIKQSVAVANARLDAIEVTIEANPLLEIFTGSPPANCAAADSGTKLASLSLPSDWMAGASSGSKAKAGTWSGTGLAAAGAGTTAGHWRLKSSGGTVHMQGTITGTGGGGDMTMDNTSIAQNQAIAISTFTLTDGNQ